jgi:antitoxin (DNA-binding transcriptional repressor) of toxin-antitoxin stability system
MKTTGVREGRQSYAALTETLQKDDEVILTHHGKPFARVLPWTGERKRERLVGRAKELAALGKSIPKPKTLSRRDPRASSRCSRSSASALSRAPNAQPPRVSRSLIRRSSPDRG